MKKNDDIIASFAGMEMRSGWNIRQSSKAHGHPVTFTLPEQEETAICAAEKERREGTLRRTRWYGEHAAELRAREALLNAVFDRISHSDRSALWPSLPLHAGFRNQALPF